ncbi:MAG TPA: hypothetical protein VIK01_18230 [Polyangiaceae bacterium]
MAGTLLVACAGKSDGSPAMGGNAGGNAAAGASSLGACDPLAAITTSVQLDVSQVVAAGQASDGSLYVIYNRDQLFVGSDTDLVERVVLGSGESPSQTDLDYTDDDGTPVVVEVVHDDMGTRMAVAHGMQKSKGIDSGNGEPLTPVDAALVAKLSASTTQTFDVDFAASLADGRELVVIAPVRGSSYDEFRVFLGPVDAVAQQTVTNFQSSQSGQRFATVTIGGAPADLTYLAGGPSALNPAGGPSTLTIAGTAYALTEGPVSAGAGYLCLAN